jgi:hypothetical protein
MTLQKITADDIVSWESLQDIADSFKKRGLNSRLNLGDEYELILQLADGEFIALVNASQDESATDYKPDNRSRHMNLVATNDFEEFTIITRSRTWEGETHGRINHQVYSFTKDEVLEDREQREDILKTLNSVEHRSEFPS